MESAESKRNSYQIRDEDLANDEQVGEAKGRDARAEREKPRGLQLFRD